MPSRFQEAAAGRLLALSTELLSHHMSRSSPRMSLQSNQYVGQEPPRLALPDWQLPDPNQVFRCQK